MSYDRPITLVLCALFIAPAPLPARQLPGQPTSPAQATKPLGTPPEAGNAQPRPAQGKLKILVLEGQDTVNSLINKSSISPVVQVLDSMEQPVEGAVVSFEVAPMGPGGSFNNAPIATVKTDYSGQASANFTPNDTTGSFVIKVTATNGGQTTEARIRQTNDRNIAEARLAIPSKPWYKNWKWWAVIGAGAGAGVATAVILSNRSGSPTITISPGPIVVGGIR